MDYLPTLQLPACRRIGKLTSPNLIALSEQAHGDEVASPFGFAGDGGHVHIDHLAGEVPLVDLVVSHDGVNVEIVMMGLDWNFVLLILLNGIKVK